LFREYEIVTDKLIERIKINITDILRFMFIHSLALAPYCARTV
jgi:hypothetical protein